MTLQQFFAQVPKAALAFSGGTDSAFLMWASRQYGCALRAYYIKTAFQPAFELADARRLAEELGVPMTVVELDVLSVPEAAENGPRRCYYCKKALFTRLRQAAAADGYTVLIDGTNASDDAGDRPGMAALREGGYVARLRRLIARERPRLTAALSALGLRVWPGVANYLLFRAEGRYDLKDRLLERGILIRSCADYAGLGPDYYRVAVRLPEEDRQLIQALSEVV